MLLSVNLSMARTGGGSTMAKRKLPDSFKESLYIEGYLHKRVADGDIPEYGYRENHLPDTSEKKREIKSSFALAKLHDPTA